MAPPERPKIYHIIHVDRLPSVLAAGCLWSDAEMVNRPDTGTVIGMNEIKQRRLNELTLASHPGLSSQPWLSRWGESNRAPPSRPSSDGALG